MSIQTRNFGAELRLLSKSSLEVLLSRFFRLSSLLMFVILLASKLPFTVGDLLILFIAKISKISFQNNSFFLEKNEEGITRSVYVMKDNTAMRLSLVPSHVEFYQGTTKNSINNPCT